MMHLITKRVLFAPSAAMFGLVGVLALGRQSAQADLSGYVNAVNTDSTKTFLATNLASSYPQQADIGALSGNNTYEFIVNSSADTSGSEALIGSTVPTQSEAIKFDQSPFTGLYGATQYGIVDYSYNVPARFNAPVVLDFVANAIAQTTTLYVDGVDTGSSVPFAVSLSGPVGLGGVFDQSVPGRTFDLFNGSIIAVATYNSDLSPAEIAAHASAYYVPEPSTFAILVLGSIGLSVRRVAHSVTRRR